MFLEWKTSHWCELICKLTRLTNQPKMASGDNIMLFLKTINEENAILRFYLHMMSYLPLLPLDCVCTSHCALIFSTSHCRIIHCTFNNLLESVYCSSVLCHYIHALNQCIFFLLNVLCKQLLYASPLLELVQLAKIEVAYLWLITVTLKIGGII